MGSSAEFPPCISIMSFQNPVLKRTGSLKKPRLILWHNFKGSMNHTEMPYFEAGEARKRRTHRSMRDQEVCMRSVLKGPFNAASLYPDWNSSWQGHQCPATDFLFTGERSNTAVVLLCGVSCGQAKRTAKSKSKLLCQRKFRFPPLQAAFCQSSEIMCFFVSFWHSLRCAKFTRLRFSISTCAKCQPSNPTADAIASMALRRSKSGVLQASSHRASKLQISVSTATTLVFGKVSGFLASQKWQF